ncbi:MAG: hydantoinase/oxoprolinase family protein, partial [Alphaproteobacteria bacterium]
MTTPKPAGGQRLAADVGGTFTDIAAFDPATGAVRYGKTLTTPDRLVRGIDAGVSKAGLAFADARLFLHGSTIAINTLLERTGARTALLTTRGFRDIYEIGRVNRPDAYNLFFRKHKPLIDRAFRIEIDERVNAAGEVLTPLDEAQVRFAAADLADMGIEAIAILFLHSYRNPAHEIRALEIVRHTCPGLFVTASHELSQEYREFERTSTVAANAYLGPRVAAYLDEVDGRLGEAGFDGSFLVVQSSGGVYDVDQARRECIRMLESGPAGGVAGARALAAETGLGDAIAFDMGGTTAKAGVIHRGEAVMTGSSMIGGYMEGLPVQIPMIDIQEVGTGGGSIARV